MTDILILKERIKNSILIGESDFREFKSAWEGKPGNKKPRLVKHICEDIAEGLVAFANSDGGELPGLCSIPIPIGSLLRSSKKQTETPSLQAR
ncbi:MAG: hypothetical protein H7246_03440 [Phycisphaerae bacterium]|nr:hypothetical protein [Saprospiraceae bacterium]